jgi:hypothetical protein
MFRILANILLILSVFFLPVYITVFLSLIFIFLFNNFVEAVFFGFILDSIYGSGSIFSIKFAYFITLLLFIFYTISFKMKKMLRISL